MMHFVGVGRNISRRDELSVDELNRCANLMGILVVTSFFPYQLGGVLSMLIWILPPIFLYLKYRTREKKYLILLTLCIVGPFALPFILTFLELDSLIWKPLGSLGSE